MYNINCPKCKQMVDPYLDLYSDKVCCELCDTELNVTNIIKQQLKSSKRTKSNKPKQSFSISCPTCKNLDRPKIVKSDFLCKKCNSDLKVTPAFKQLYAQYISKADSDVE